MTNFLADLRHAARMLLTNRGFTVASVVALALGIGANTAIFSVVNGVLLRPLPFRDADRIVRLWASYPERNLPFFSVSAADFADWKHQNRVFDQMAAYDRQRDAALTGDHAEQVPTARVSRDLFELLGVPPYVGRAFSRDEDRPGVAARVVVLSHGFWQRRFGGDLAAVGKVLTLEGDTYEIVGVMPPGFAIPLNDAELWTPLGLDPKPASRDNRFLRVLARLKPGVTPERAWIEIDTIARRLQQQFPSTNAGWTVSLRTLTDTVIGEEFRQSLLVLLGAVGFVLLIACANVANLLLARAAARRKEIAIRTALGAGRARLLRQLLTESLLLAAIGGGLGLLLAMWGIDLLRAIEPPNIPRLADVVIDRRVLAFTIVMSLLTGVLFGVIPALQASRPDVIDSLKNATSATTGGRARQRARNVLVVAEVTLALVLLVGAGLIVQSFVRMQRLSPGFSQEGLVLTQIALPSASYAQPTQILDFYSRLIDRVRALPDVQAAAAVSSAPFAGPNQANVYGIEGQPLPDGTQPPDADVRVITEAYFRTMNIPIRSGRTFGAQDRLGAPETVIINEAMARRHWPGQNPVGERLRIGDVKDQIATIVGIVGDVKYQQLDAPGIRPMVYFSHLASPRASMALVVRTTADPATMAAALRAEVAAIDRNQPVANVATMERILDSVLSQRRFNVMLFGLFGLVALTLAAVGIFGVVSYSVTQRTREIGIRMALGANRADVMGLVVRQGMGLAIGGVALGIVAALALTRLLGGLLYQVSPTDPATFAGVASMLAVVALVASYVPARRATKVDPLVALRTE